MNEVFEVLQVITPVIVAVATVGGKVIFDRFRIDTAEAIQAESKKTRAYIDKMKDDLSESIANIQKEMADNNGQDRYRDRELQRLNEELLIIKKKVFK